MAACLLTLVADPESARAADGRSVSDLSGVSPGLTVTAAPAEELTLTLPGGVTLVLVRVPAGAFMMGSPTSERGFQTDESPQHEVTLTQSYYLGRTEVTQRQWAAVMGTNPAYFASCGLDCPVEMVSWNDVCGGTTGSDCTAESFIGKLNAYLGTTKLRLPTEAEWERAARGGTTTPFSFVTPGSWDINCGTFPEAEAAMWWCGNAANTSHTVAQKQPNPFDLLDMHGNIRELVADRYGTYPSTAQVDPTGPATGTSRIARGGGWGTGSMYCRSARREARAPESRSTGVGFRLARSLDVAMCAYAVSPTQRTHGSGAESGTFTVTTASGCAWTAISNHSWLSLAAGASGSGSGTVTYSVAANPGAKRTGSITVEGQTFTVTQGAGGAGASIASPGFNVYLVSASAHSSGAAGSKWVSDLVIHNPSQLWATANVYFLKKGQDGSGQVGRLVSVPPGATVRLADVVQQTFAESSAAGALLVGSNAELVVTSRTFNNAPSGTFGQYIEGYPVTRAIGTGQEVRLIGLAKSADYRTNIGFANVSASALAITVRLFGAGGASVGNARTVTVPPFGYLQEDDIFTKAGAGAQADAYAIVSSATAGARYFTYASVIDGRTNDPVCVVPVQPGSSTTRVFLPAGAHASGVSGTNWKTDLEIHNPGSTQAAFTVALLRKDQENIDPRSVGYTLGAGQSMRYLDALSSLFGHSGAGTLLVSASSGSVMATSRTYNDQPGGTYGQFIGGVPAAAAVVFGQDARLVQLAQAATDTSGFRTNLGMVNTGATTISVEIKLYRGDGTSLGTVTQSLRALEFKQLDKVFRLVTTTDVADGFAVLRTTTSGGSFLAYASVIDNRSGDPIYVPAQVLSESFVMLPGGVYLWMKRIPAGTFAMGSPEGELGRDADEGPQHPVTLTQDFLIGTSEVSQRQWLAVMGTNPSYFASCGLSCPVEQVSWDEICGGSTGSSCTADSFIGKLNAHLGTTTFRLPTEAEWEWAARGPTTTPFSFPTPATWDTACGSLPEAGSFMWWCGNSDQTTHNSGNKLTNPYGLFDMHGNVWEWVGDWYGPYPGEAQTDPTGPGTGTQRVLRGGSWYSSAAVCRSASRVSGSPDNRGAHWGFRVVASP